MRAPFTKTWRLAVCKYTIHEKHVITHIPGVSCLPRCACQLDRLLAWGTISDLAWSSKEEREITGEYFVLMEGHKEGCHKLLNWGGEECKLGGGERSYFKMTLISPPSQKKKKLKQSFKKKQDVKAQLESECGLGFPFRWFEGKCTK